MNNDNTTIAHTKWNCKYHIVFAPKYRQKVFYKDKRSEVGKILRALCAQKEGVELIEGEVCPDHVHIFVSIPPKYSIGSFMGYVKGKSALRIYERWPELRYKNRNRGFWCRGYYVESSGKAPQKIQLYIKKQLKEDARLPYEED